MNTVAGKLVFSFDFELGWGSIENGLWASREKSGVFERCRYVVPRLLSILDEYEIPSTWATVGAMVDCEEKRSFDHLPDTFKSSIHSATNTSKSSTFDGRDLYEKVLASRHARVSCHTYSHVRMNHHSLSEDFIHRELDLFANALGEAVQHPFFVFPQNIEAYHEVIASRGFVAARRTEYDVASRHLGTFKRYFLPSATSEIVNHPSSLIMKRGNVFFNCGVGAVKRRLWPLVLRQARSNIEGLSRRYGEFHIWNHPFNFAEHDLLLDDFEALIQRAVYLRDKMGLLITLA